MYYFSMSSLTVRQQLHNNNNNNNNNNNTYLTIFIYQKNW